MKNKLWFWKFVMSFNDIAEGHKDTDGVLDGFHMLCEGYVWHLIFLDEVWRHENP